MALVPINLTAARRIGLLSPWLPLTFRLLAITLGGLHAWAGIASGSMSEDGINYLDMGDAFFRGDWSVAINPVWSPLYALVLGATMRILAPPMAWEFGVVQLVNLALYLGALACFEFFWRQLRQHRAANDADQSRIRIPEWAWIALGYVLFIWSSLSLIKIWVVTPDLLVAAIVYLIAGLAVRICRNATTWRDFILLGALLGLAYLAKSIMFPVALVFLLTILLCVGSLRQTLPRIVVAFSLFLLVAGPFVGAISITKGRLTFGEAGTLTYVRYVNGVPYPHWQGAEAGSGTPSHASRRIMDSPPIYEFGTPIGGTYPVSYDPSYWYEGVATRLDLGQQTGTLLRSGLFYLDLFFRQQGGMLVGIALLYLMGLRPRLQGKTSRLSLLLIVPSLTVFTIYAIVYTESRYLGPFVVLFWAGLLSGIRLPESQESKRLVAATSGVMLLFMLISIGTFNLEGLSTLAFQPPLGQSVGQRSSASARAEQVAEELVRAGVKANDKVAVIGYAFSSFWARLARVRIVAEMLSWEADSFWLGDRDAQMRVIDAFASTGAKAIIAEDVPSYATLTDWQRLGNSNYFIYDLAR